MRNDVRKLTLCAVLTAAALVTFVIELQLPPLTGIPGIKPGLANIFTLFALCWLGRGWAFANDAGTQFNQSGYTYYYRALG